MIEIPAGNSIATVGGKDHESAESYFKNIEEQTGTLILWPSKLKIGAKSKKGTHTTMYMYRDMDMYVHVHVHRNHN